MIRRWLFNIAAAVSLLLCVATAVIWVRSYWAFQAMFVLKVDREWGLISSRGDIALSGGIDDGLAAGDEQRGLIVSNKWQFAYVVTPPNDLTRLGWATYRSRWEFSPEHVVIGLPHSVFFAAFGILPTAWWFLSRKRWLRNRRLGKDLCLTCGYSLTGNISGTCPECGTPVPSNPEVIE